MRSWPLSPDAHLDLAPLLGEPVLVELLTTQSASQRRAFDGHISICLGNNGGLARYELMIKSTTTIVVHHAAPVLQVADYSKGLQRIR